MGSPGTAAQSAAKQSRIRLAVFGGDRRKAAVTALLLRKPRSFGVRVAPLAGVSMGGLWGHGDHHLRSGPTLCVS